MAGFKPRNTAHHDKLMASGEVIQIEPPKAEVFRHLASRDTYGRDRNGRFITGHLPLQLSEFPHFQINQSGFKRFAGDLEEAATKVLSALGSPIAGITAAALRINLQPAMLVLSALSEEDDRIKALRLVDLYGPDNVAAWARSIEEALR